MTRRHPGSHPVLGWVERHASERGERLAAADQSLMLSYGAFLAVTRGLGEQVRGLTACERVGILAPTSAACAAAIFSCWHAGKVPVPLNFLLAPEELRQVIAHAELDAAIVVDRFVELASSMGLRPLTLDGQTMTPAASAPAAGAGSSTAVILYTSGSTGRPKGVCLSFDNITSNAWACIEKAAIGPEDIFLSILPQFHSYGFTMMTVAPLLLGATVWYLPRFSPLLVAHTIAERGVSVFTATASLFAALLKLRGDESPALSSLKLAISGGEPLAIPVAEEFERRFGVRILEGYGLTETSPVVALNVPGARRLGSVGTPLPEVEVFPVDREGRYVARGAEGELLVRGPCVMQGYYRDPAATAELMRDGAFRTGDIGRVDEDGFVYITGRAKEMLIVGGENVFPVEIERVLSEHPAVAEVAVVGARDALRGEEPVAFVILREGVAADALELRRYCRERLAAYKVPREIRFVSDFPRTPAGKIMKRSLL